MPGRSFPGSSTTFLLLCSFSLKQVQVQAHVACTHSALPVPGTAPSQFLHFPPALLSLSQADPYSSYCTFHLSQAGPGPCPISCTFHLICSHNFR
uniref:Secreted protein n=1 Tax=Pyxicephalus adspersus TaxID=30357 RepID=A0AAV2ZN55_PYXAD|nr:TPA: hypothetical protein GDO54_003263 [Pyxicephalus adspersus]